MITVFRCLQNWKFQKYTSLIHSVSVYPCICLHVTVLRIPERIFLEIWYWGVLLKCAHTFRSLLISDNNGHFMRRLACASARGSDCVGNPHPIILAWRILRPVTKVKFCRMRPSCYAVRKFPNFLVVFLVSLRFDVRRDDKNNERWHACGLTWFDVSWECSVILHCYYCCCILGNLEI